MGSIELIHANDKESKEEIFRFRFEVIDNTGTYQPSIDYDAQKIEEPIDHKSWLVASKEAGSITGSFRVFTLDKESFEFAPHTHLDQWLEILEPKEISCTSKFMIYGSRRKNRTILMLLQEHYKLLVSKGIKLDLICCPEPTLPYYEWIGYRKFSKPFHHSTSPWALVPMCVIVDDTDYLQKINSPLHCPELNVEPSKTLSNFLEKNFMPEFTTTSAYIQLRRLSNKYNLLFKNELMKPYVDSLKHNKYLNNETIYAEGENGNSIHIIVAGKAQRNGELLKIGDFFGESCMLSPGPREHTVAAKGRLETLELVSEDFYNILKEKPETAPYIMQMIGEKLKEI